MKRVQGREREAKLIHKANRAAVVGRLMLGELSDWIEFLEADLIDLKKLPRRQLKSGQADVKRRLASEIRDFCSKNFDGMSIDKLSELYEEIKAYRGLEITLKEFEERFAPVRKAILRGNPAHLTICISLWGFQWKFPEDELAKDIIEGLRLGSEAQTKLQKYGGLSHVKLMEERNDINLSIVEEKFAARSILINCFNLIEAYLNGLAWDYIQTHNIDNLSNRNKKLLEDSSSISIREKLLKYPKILTDRVLWKQPDPEIEEFLDTIKPFRDSLVHPSPFSAPEKFGGYDKLRMFYRISFETAKITVHQIVNLIERIHGHVHGKESQADWMRGLTKKVRGVQE